MRKLRRLVVALLMCTLFAGMIPVASAESYVGYSSLDPDPAEQITFDGDTVTWAGKTFNLDDNTIFLDYRLDSAQIAGNPYAFNNFDDAKAALKNGTASKPMILLTAPGVYWIDDPDDPAIRTGIGSSPPYGAEISCTYLYFYGLSSDPYNVVFAVNRGQTQGASGNFTMFRITGAGLKSENVTFGNYCNVDLEFPLDPSLSREKRAEAIAQAQLFSYTSNSGSVAINTNFISRLNLMPFAQTYVDCRIESSGHAGGGSVYIGCELYFYNTNFSASNFFDCDIYLVPFYNNYNGKSVYEFGFADGYASGYACIDTRFHRSQELIDAGIPAQVSWDKFPQSSTTRGYQYNVTMDGEPYVIQENATPGATVIIPDSSSLLKAYKVEHEGKVYYNAPNILSGLDPLNYKASIQAAAIAAGESEDFYLTIPRTVTLTTSASTIRSGQTTATLTYSARPPAYGSSTALGNWSFYVTDPSLAGLVNILDEGNGKATVTGTNHGEETANIIIVAQNELGIEGAVAMTVQPAFVDAPTFVTEPVITAPNRGKVSLNYELDLGNDARSDESIITWYRCTDSAGADPFKVSVSRLGMPEKEYTLSVGDVGYYLMATISPKHNLSDPGEELTAYSSFIIEADDVRVHHIDTNFQNLPTDPQPQILPGTWTLDGYFAPECVDTTKQPDETGYYRYTASPDSWMYGAGTSGSLGYIGLDQKARGARLFYAPAAGNYDDMLVRAVFAPDKSAGQGFGSATDQFMEVFIKFDLETMSGYGLRLQRLDTVDINSLGFDGNGAVAGVAAWLVKYDNGDVSVISEKVMTSAFLTECTIELEVKEGRLYGTVSSTQENEIRSGSIYGYLETVLLDAPIDENGFGGTGMLYTSTVGSNSTLVLNWETYWGPEAANVPRLAVNRRVLNFDEIEVGTTSQAQSLTVIGNNLLDDIAFDVPEGFTLTKASDWSNIKGGDITITFAPVNAGFYSGVLRVYSGSDLVSRVRLLGTGAIEEQPVVVPPGANITPTAPISNFTNEDYQSPQILGITAATQGNGALLKAAVIGAAHYQWQIETANGWVDIAGATKDEYFFAGPLTEDVNIRVIAISFTGLRSISDPYLISASGLQSGIWMVNASRLNIRKSPGGAVIDKLTKGSLVTIIKTEGDWSYIEYAGGKTGWAATIYLKAVKPMTAGEYITTSNLRVRSADSGSSATLAILPVGSKVTVLQEAKNGYVQITFQGGIAYVHASFLK